MIARHAEDLGAEMEEKNRKLTPKGIKQANQLGTIILKFNPECIITSTLRRAKETIEYSKVPNDIIIIQQSLFNEQQMGSDKSENL